MPALNVRDGMSATVLDRLITERVRADGAKQAAEKRKQEGISIVDHIRQTKRLTTGVLTLHGVHSLNNPRFLAPFKEQQQHIAKKKAKIAADKKAKTAKGISAVKQLREKFGHESTHLFHNFNMDNCRDYLQYKKQKKDPGMPKSLP